ncbi:hypothetical protein BH09BAC1_BH09BAC1_22980 [soil metagenome]
MDPIEGIVKSMYGTRKRLLWWGSGLLGGAVALLIALFLLPIISSKALFGLLLFVIFLCICGIYLLVLAATILHPYKHPVVKHLRQQKHQIVWVYSFISINKPFGIELFKLVTVWLHYRDGSQQHIRIGHVYLNDCMAHLQATLPHATFGYSVEKEQLYRVNPALLERE